MLSELLLTACSCLGTATHQPTSSVTISPSSVQSASGNWSSNNLYTSNSDLINYMQENGISSGFSYYTVYEDSRMLSGTYLDGYAGNFDPITSAAVANGYYEYDEAGNLVKLCSLGCGRYGLFFHLNHLAVSGVFPGIYDPALPLEINQENLMSRILELCDCITNDCNNVAVLWHEYRNTFETILSEAYPDRYVNFNDRSNYGTQAGILSKIKESIDHGMPATALLPMDGGNIHYLTVYGYQTVGWQSHDFQTHEHLFFIASANWGNGNLYFIDSDVFGDSLAFLTTLNFLTIETDTVAIQTKPEDFDYGADYPDTLTSKSISLENPIVRPFSSSQAISVDTIRKRTHNYEDECIVLSPRREGHGTADWRITFPCDIKAIDIELAKWRVDEYFDGDDESGITPTYLLQYQVDGSSDWVTSFDIYSSISEIGPSRQYMVNFYFTFPEGVNAIRIYGETDAMGDRNSGRIAIGNIDFHLEDGFFANC